MTGAEHYISNQPNPHRLALDQLRITILTAVPDCVEAVRRRVPAFLLDAKQLVSIGAARHHVSLYVMYGNALDHYAHRLAGFDVSNTVVRFDPRHPIPAELVTDIVTYRAGEIRGIPFDRCIEH